MNVYRRTIEGFKGVTGYSRIINALRVNTALSRGALSSQLREIKEDNPTTWEFSAFSQNGEDGIIDFLTRKIIEPNNYFIEIGAYDGIECNTSYLSVARKFTGLMIEGDKKRSAAANRLQPMLNLGCICKQAFISKDNVKDLKSMAQRTDPDVFSLDIDGVDYYVAKEIMASGFRPKIFVVEYNSVYGPDKATTIEYDKEFDYAQADKSKLYYGVSVGGWKKFFAKYDYKFVTVDSRGVNAFFIDPKQFEPSFVSKIKGLAFRDNFNHVRKHGGNYQSQFKMISNHTFKEI